MQLALDITDPLELTLAARQLPFPGGILQRWLPTRTRLDHRYRFFKRDRSLRRAAPVRAWDTPAVPIERGQVEEVTGRMLPISVILPLLEEESQLLDAARASTDEVLVASVFDNDLLETTRRVLQRIMLMQGEAIASGKVTIGTQAAPENGLQLGSVDFGIPAGQYITAGTLWSAGGVDILDQLSTYKQTYITTTGHEVSPGVMITSQRVANAMVTDAKLREVFGSILGTPASIGVNQLNQVLGDRQLPRLIVDDTAVPDHNGTMTRQIPDDRIVFLPEDPANGGMAVGQTQFGTTEEAKKLAQAQVFDAADTPGLVVVPMTSDNPVQTATLATAIVMPVVSEPDLIMSVKVL
jgi:hypothetical protein